MSYLTCGPWIGTELVSRASTDTKDGRTCILGRSLTSTTWLELSRRDPWFKVFHPRRLEVLTDRETKAETSQLF